VVVAMLSDPAAALSPSATPELLAIVRGPSSWPGNPEPGRYLNDREDDTQQRAVHDHIASGHRYGGCRPSVSV
jgi:hypothetical protein